MGLGWGSSHDAFGYSNPDYPEPEPDSHAGEDEAYDEWRSRDDVITKEKPDA